MRNGAMNPRNLKPLRMASVAALVLALAPGAALAGDAVKKSAEQTRMEQSTSAQQAEAKSEGRGDKLTLTQKEADAWAMRPVLSKDGKEVGHVAALTLNKSGKVAELRVEPEGMADAGPFTVKAKDFTFKAGKVTLAMNQEQIKEQASRQ